MLQLTQKQLSIDDFETEIIEKAALFGLKHIFPVKVNYNYLHYRQQLMAQKQEHLQEWREPVLNIHPYPICDICILNIQTSYKEQYNELAVKPLQLKVPVAAQALNSQADKTCLVVGFGQVDDIISLNSADYKFLLSRSILKTLENKLNKTHEFIQNQLNFPAIKFYNKGKSVFLCEFYRANSNLIAYFGSPNKGTSGSPLFDAQGEVCGLTFAYLEDVFMPGLLQDCHDQLMQDIYFEEDQEFIKRMNNHIPKNFNLAITLKAVFDFIQQVQSLIPKEIMYNQKEELLDLDFEEDPLQGQDIIRKFAANSLKEEAKEDGGADIEALNNNSVTNNIINNSNFNQSSSPGKSISPNDAKDNQSKNENGQGAETQKIPGEGAQQVKAETMKFEYETESKASSIYDYSTSYRKRRGKKSSVDSKRQESPRNQKQQPKKIINKKIGRRGKPKGVPEAQAAAAAGHEQKIIIKKNRLKIKLINISK